MAPFEHFHILFDERYFRLSGQLVNGSGLTEIRMLIFTVTLY